MVPRLSMSASPEELSHTWSLGPHLRSTTSEAGNRACAAVCLSDLQHTQARRPEAGSLITYASASLPIVSADLLRSGV